MAASSDTWRFRLRASPRAYAWLLGLTSIPLMLAVLLVIRRSSDAIEFVAWSALLPAFWAVWLAAFRIDVDGSGLSYRRPFFRRTSLRWSEIASVEVKRGLWKRSVGVAAPFARIVVTAVDAKQTIVINPRPFSFQDLDACVTFMKSMREASVR